MSYLPAQDRDRYFQGEFDSTDWRQTSLAKSFQERHGLHAASPAINGVAGDFCQCPAFSSRKDRNRYREAGEFAMIIRRKSFFRNRPILLHTVPPIREHILAYL